MDNKIILVTSGGTDAENLLNSISDLITDTRPFIVEASIYSRQLANPFPDTRTMEEVKDLVLEKTEHFQKICLQRKLNHARRPHYDNYFVKDLIDDSRFADLIVFSSDFFSNDRGPYDIKAMLQNLECPILILSEKTTELMPVDLFVFDGRMDSINAIKTYTYLFPQRCNRKAMIYSASATADQILNMTAWISAHYNSFKWVKELPAHGQYNLICGSFRKTLLTNPVFIYHT